MKKQAVKAKAAEPTVLRKTLIGKVVSLKRLKTVGVEVTRFIEHPLYKKSIKRNRTFAAHNETVEVKMGDTVKIAEIKPMSKTKHFIVVEVIKV